MKVSKHFKATEFKCKCGCGFGEINKDLIIILEDIREHFNSPVIITSGCRCKQNNHIVGGKANSQHLFGNASDIKVKGVSPEIVADYLESKYINKYGIGRYLTFTHIDVRKGKARWGI